MRTLCLKNFFTEQKYRIKSLLFLYGFLIYGRKSRKIVEKYTKNSLQIPVNRISNTVKYYNTATKIKHPDGCFIFVVIGIGLDTATKLPGSEQAHTVRAVKGARERSSWELQSLTIRQYSGMYVGTDKKPAL